MCHLPSTIWHLPGIICNLPGSMWHLLATCINQKWAHGGCQIRVSAWTILFVIYLFIPLLFLSFYLLQYLLCLVLYINPSWPGGAFLLQNQFWELLFLCTTHYGKLSKKWFSTIFQIFLMGGRICLPPPRSLCNSCSPGQLGLITKKSIYLLNIYLFIQLMELLTENMFSFPLIEQ